MSWVFVSSSNDIPSTIVKKNTKETKETKNIKEKPTALWVDQCRNTQDELAQCSDHIKTLATMNQTHGRGRRGRIWQAPPQATLCISHRLTDIPMDQMRYIPLIVAVCLWETLVHHPYTKDYIEDDQSLRIKWPNDLLFHTKKLAGILCEARSLAHTADSLSSSSHTLLLGIGINCHAHAKLPPQAIALHHEKWGHPIQWTQWIDQLWTSLQSYLYVCKTQGPQSILDKWRHYALPVGTRMQQNNIQGVYQDIDIDGSLCLLNQQGLHRIDSGEVDVITSSTAPQ